MRYDDASPHKWGGGRKRPKNVEDWPEKTGAAADSRVSDGASPQIACGSYRSGDAGRAEETAPQASRTSLPPVLSPIPSG